MILLSFIFLSLFSTENFRGQIEYLNEATMTETCNESVDKPTHNYHKHSEVQSQDAVEKQGSIGIIGDKAKDSSNTQY